MFADHFMQDRADLPNLLQVKELLITNFGENRVVFRCILDVCSACLTY